MNRKNSIELLIVFCLAVFAANAQTNGYLYKRALKPGPEQWQTLLLPDDIFAKLAPNFSDLRIIGITKSGDTLTVPYLLQNTKAKAENTEVEFKLINQAKTAGGYYYTFEQKSQLSINQIDLNFARDNFNWRINLEGSEDRQQWFGILSQYRLVSIKNDLTDYHFTRLQFYESKYRYFRLFINTNENPAFIGATLLMKTTRAASMKNYPVVIRQVRVDKRARQTVIDIGLAKPMLLNQLKFFVHDTVDYYRHVTAQWLVDSFKIATGWEYNYQYLGETVLSRLEKNELNFEDKICRRIQLTVSNQDNNPLQIDSVQATGNSYYLLARFTEPADYFLIYGNAAAIKPAYDIEHFTATIPQTAPQLTVGDEEQITISAQATTKPLFQNKAWLWAIMIVIIFVLGFFSYKMLSKL